MKKIRIITKQSKARGRKYSRYHTCTQNLKILFQREHLRDLLLFCARYRWPRDDHVEHLKRIQDSRAQSPFEGRTHGMLWFVFPCWVILMTAAISAGKLLDMLTRHLNCTKCMSGMYKHLLMIRISKTRKLSYSHNAWFSLCNQCKCVQCVTRKKRDSYRVI